MTECNDGAIHADATRRGAVDIANQLALGVLPGFKQEACKARWQRDYVARNIIPLMLRRTLCCEAAARVAIDAGFSCPVSRRG